ncbi:MAG: helix-turn-helix domain-containing protein [Clostridia bacterium]|nr:helix-turn-helix domain-containing protein [Clostridia bacterium]
MAFIEIDKAEKLNAWNMNDLHSHPHFEIYYLAKGERMFFLDNSLYRIKAPTLVVIPPYAMHKTEGGPFTKYNVNVAENYLNAFEKEILGKMSLNITSPTAKQDEEMQALLELMATPYKEPKYRGTVIQTLFSYYILKLSELKKASFENVSLENDRVPTVVLKIIDYLNKNYNQKITLDLLSKLFFTSKPAILYNFKKYTNRSPIDFLLDIRVNRAKELIGSNLEINQIADRCGFSSANYFGLIFKKRVGVSPANYRKHKRE